jgi:tetratricopeptide (TPR) repeat protein
MQHLGSGRLRVIALCGIVACLQLFPVPAGRAAPGPPAATSLSAPAALAALEASLRGEDRAADSLLAAAQSREPEDPRLWLARIQIAWWELLAEGDPQGTLEDAMQADFAHLNALAHHRPVAGAMDPATAFALGEAHCTLGRLEGLRGHAWGALRHHQQGVALLEEVLREDPTAPEPRASLGVFRYYTARLPRSLRLVARLVRVRGDRERGLADLRAAAAAPGVQQAEAAFFLTEILSHSEDETLEALGLASRSHTLYPRQLAFTLELADVLLGLERPDLAIATLGETEARDPVARSQSSLLAARIYLESGRPAAALARLAQVTPEARSAVGWVGAWYEVVSGASLLALGRTSEGAAHLAVAERGEDLAGSRSAARAARARAADPLAPARTFAESLLAWDGDARSARLRLEVACAAHPDACRDPEFQYLLGSAALRAGDPRTAARCFRVALEGAGGDQAWLRVRPAIRLLQALQWAGEVEAARAVARRLSPQLGSWGTNQQLAGLVAELTAPETEPPRFSAAVREAPGMVLRLKDTGFTGVAVRIHGLPERSRIPMTFCHGYWEVRVPAAHGDLLYGFDTGCGALLVDPGAAAVLELEGTLWSRPAASAGAS